MSVIDTSGSAAVTTTEAFDPRALVSRKPSDLPAIYEYVITHGPTTPKEIRESVDVSPSVVPATLTKLQDVRLVDKVDHGVYAPAPMVLEPRVVSWLGELRSEKQYEVCRWAVEAADFDAGTLADHVGGTRSNVRTTATRLVEQGFLDQRLVPARTSRKRYRLTEAAKEALDALDIGRYRGWPSHRSVVQEGGVGGSPFLTAYEVEDAGVMAHADDDWHHPETVATALDRNVKKTRRRFKRLAERGLLEVTAEADKQVFRSTAKTGALIDHLRLFTYSRAVGLDVYSLAAADVLGEGFTLDELYDELARNGDSTAVRKLRRTKTALKCAGLLEGDRLTGYSFAIE